MSTFSLAGSGTHALSAGTTGLQVAITTPSAIGGVGRSNPIAKYDQGLIRFSDGSSYWAPVPIMGGPQFIPVPANATSIGYAMLGGAAVSITEVIGGTVFFSGGASSIATLSDVTLASLADAQILAWSASASKWENVNQPGPAGLGSPVILAKTVLSASAASFDFSGISGAYDILVVKVALKTDAGGQTIVNVELNGDTTAAHYLSLEGGAASKRLSVVAYGGGDIEWTPLEYSIPRYAISLASHIVQSTQTLRPTADGELSAVKWTPAAASAVTGFKIFPASGNFVADSWAMLLGY